MKKQIVKLSLSAMFIAIGLVLPFLTGQIRQIGNMLLPMHFPVFLCGMICSWQYGAAVGIILPILRSLIFGMPPLFPTATAMAFELCAYGLVVGFVYGLFKKKNLVAIYVSLFSAMICGRAIWGIVQTILLSSTENPFSFTAFIAGAFTNAVPGIIAQLVLIPAIVFALEKTGAFKKLELRTR